MYGLCSTQLACRCLLDDIDVEAGWLNCLELVMYQTAMCWALPSAAEDGERGGLVQEWRIRQCQQYVLGS